MSDQMQFPESVDEFMEFFKMTDTEEVYSNGTEYVPIFRMKQWFEHEEAKRTAKVIELNRRSETMMAWEGKCSNCGSYTIHEMDYCHGCGAKLEWK